MDIYSLPPNYVKNVLIQNYTQHNITLLVHFHQNLKTYEVSPGQEIIAENQINKGTWKAFDPVEKIIVQSGWHIQDQKILKSLEGVITLRYKVESVNGKDTLLELEKDH